MSAGSPNPTDVKMLPSTAATTQIVQASSPARQLSDLPKEELDHLAEDLGLDPRDFRTKQHEVTG